MRYIIKQKFFSFGDSFTIKNEADRDVFVVKSQLLSFGKKLRIYDLEGNELCYIEQKLLKFMPEYDIYIAGQHVANIKKKFAFFKNDFVITSQVDQYYINGDFIGHEFGIYKGDEMVARISKKFFSFRDTYGVEIDDRQDQVTILAIAIVIDMVCHDSDNG
ncbi:MAG: LURP-one-related family protein [Clostridia bacterium]|nr:LURP-one-related family protein [Clostridia bacterium]